MIEKHQYLVGAVGLLVAAAFLLWAGFQVAQARWRARAIPRTAIGWKTPAAFLGGGATCLVVGIVFLLFWLGLIEPAPPVEQTTYSSDVLYGLLTVVAGVCVFAVGFLFQRDRERMKRQSLTKCATLRPGAVALAGLAAGHAVAKTPLTRMPCLFSRIRVFEIDYSAAGHSSYASTELLCETFGGAFHIEDESGRALVVPFGAMFELNEIDYDMKKGFRRREARQSLASAGITENALVSRFREYWAETPLLVREPGTKTSSESRMRFVEESVLPGDPIYVVGSAESEPEPSGLGARMVIRKGAHYPQFIIGKGTPVEVQARWVRGMYWWMLAGAAIAAFGVLVIWNGLHLL